MSDAHRKARLKHLIAEDYGKPAVFAVAAGKSKGRVSQMYGPNAPFGELAARSLAQKIRLPDDWFNNNWPTPKEAKRLGVLVSEPYPSSEAATTSKAPIQLSAVRQTPGSLLVQLGEALRLLDATDRAIAGLILRDLAADPTQAQEMGDKLDRLVGGVASAGDHRKAG